MTSHPPRFAFLPDAIRRLRSQTCQPSLITVNIAKDSIRDLPKLDPPPGVPMELFPIDDMGPASKLIPTMTRYPFETVITIDDDVIYRPNLFDALSSHSVRHPGVVISGLARLIPHFPFSRFVPYTAWPFAQSSTSGAANELLLPLGAEGVLYPPHSLHPDVLNVELLRKIAFLTDDLWFWVHRVRARKPLHCLPTQPLQARVDGSDETGLWRHNKQGANRATMRVLMRMIKDEAPQDFGSNLFEWARTESGAFLSKKADSVRRRMNRAHVS